MYKKDWCLKNRKKDVYKYCCYLLFSQGLEQDTVNEYYFKNKTI